jgi:hypothetical protein
MRIRNLVLWLAFSAVAVVLLLVYPIDAGLASAGAMGLVPSSRIGWNADRTTGGNDCAAVANNECQSSEPTSMAGGFNYPDSVAVDARTGNIYVAEISNYRVQEFTAAGVFVSMFGWDVNKTRDKQGAGAQSGKNVCTAVSSDVCQRGVAGVRAGQLDSPESVTVDQRTGDVYVLQIEADDFHVDKFARDGKFMWRVGKDVDQTTGENLCVAGGVKRAADRCVAGMPNGSGSVEHSAFKFTNQSGDLLAVGGPEHLLYVGDEHRVQVFGTDGIWKREILLTSLSAESQSSVVALALTATGELYLVYRAGAAESYLPSERANIVHRFDPNGGQIAEYKVTARDPGALDSIDGMALDRAGQLAVIGVESGTSTRFGLLLSASTGSPLAGFTPPIDNDGIAFDGGGDLYIATAVDQEVAVYAPAMATGTLAGPIPCEALGSRSQDQLDCP